MALEKRDGSQIVTFLPPRPAKSFSITLSGSSATSEAFGGSDTDGRRYGWIRINSSQWETENDTQADYFNGTSANTHSPLENGEQFQLWTTNIVGLNYPSSATLYDSSGAADLYEIFNLQNALPNVSGAQAPLVMKDPTVCVVQGIKQVAHGSWEIYFSPDITESINTSTDGIITLPVPRDPRWLNAYGHVDQVNYTFTIPGGPSAFQCLFVVPPDFRTTAMDPGRILQVFRGGQCIWEGITTEPTPSSTGWQIAANGAGAYGTNFTCFYDVWDIGRPLQLALDRGLRWLFPPIIPATTKNNPEQAYLGPAQTSGSMTITDFLNLVCTTGRLYWTLIPPVSAGIPACPWRLEFLEFPTDQSGNPLAKVASDHANYLSREWRRVDQPLGSDLSATRRPPDLYLVSTSPVARNMNATYNTLILNYMTQADQLSNSQNATGTAAAFNTAVVDIPESVARYGRVEYFLDLTNGGALSHAQAVSIGRNVLNKYIRVNFTTPFSVQPGQLLNSGGQPVDLACDWSGRTISVVAYGIPFGGESQFGPLTFFAGGYQYDDNSQTATITPYQNAGTDIATVVAMLYPGTYA
jgi:hypothetical protein